MAFVQTVYGYDVIEITTAPVQALRGTSHDRSHVTVRNVASGLLLPTSETRCRLILDEGMKKSGNVLLVLHLSQNIIELSRVCFLVLPERYRDYQTVTF